MSRHEFHQGDGAQQEIDDRPSLPVAELRGHGDGPIHIVRFTGEEVLFIPFSVPLKSMMCMIHDVHAVLLSSGAN